MSGDGGTVLWIQIEPPVDLTASECPVCGFDTVLVFRTFLLTGDGVTRCPQMDVPTCVRCTVDTPGC